MKKSETVNMDDEKPLHYCTYLLAAWEERIKDGEMATTWRFSLERTQMGTRNGFANLSELIIFLEKQLLISTKDDTT